MITQMKVKFRCQIPMGVSEGTVFHALGLKYEIPFKTLNFDNGRLDIDNGRWLYNNVFKFEVITEENKSETSASNTGGQK